MSAHELPSQAIALELVRRYTETENARKISRAIKCCHPVEVSNNHTIGILKRTVYSMKDISNISRLITQ
jgi:hypothetical protein